MKASRVLLLAIACVAGLTPGCGGTAKSAASPGRLTSSPKSLTTPTPTPGTSRLRPRVAVVHVGGHLLVVRRHGSRDLVWLVTPATGRARPLCRLPFRATVAEASPDRRSVAYLPEPPGESGRWVPGLVVVSVRTGTWRAYRLPHADVRFVDSLAWVSPTRLVLSGKPRGGYEDQPLSDRIAFLDLTTGSVSLGFPGAEPTVAAGRLAYVTFSDAGPNRPFGGRREIERLLLRDLSTGTQRVLGQGLLQGEYGGIRYFAHPRLSPDGSMLFSCQRGHEAAMEAFELRVVASGALLFHYDAVGDVQSAWDDQGRHLAFAGLIGTPVNAGPKGLWVYDTVTGRLHRSRPQLWLASSLFFSPAGDLAISTGNVYIAKGGDPRRVSRLMLGDLPVWVDESALVGR